MRAPIIEEHGQHLRHQRCPAGSGVDLVGRSTNLSLTDFHPRCRSTNHGRTSQSSLPLTFER